MKGVSFSANLLFIIAQQKTTMLGENANNEVQMTWLIAYDG
jgi:hypothetical protein